MLFLIHAVCRYDEIVDTNTFVVNSDLTKIEYDREGLKKLYALLYPDVEISLVRANETTILSKQLHNLRILFVTIDNVITI